MTEHVERLVEALRDELQQYGEMLSLLDQQHQFIMVWTAEEVFQLVSPLKSQGCLIQNARAHREECRRDIARLGKQSDNADFPVLMQLLPPDYRPLVTALVDENNELLVRVRQRARQNHLLLSRSVEMMQGLLDTLLPARETRIHNDHGATSLHRIVPHGASDAMG